MRDGMASAAAVIASSRVPALDGIRGVAIVWVVFHNTVDMPLTPSGRWLHLVSQVVGPGWIGVQLFFALSGFLITAGLLASQGAAGYFRNFYAKRALRILPLYYSVLLLLLVILPPLVTFPAPFSTQHQAPLWLFTANWIPSLPYGFGHFWSLSVEEQFYLCWPLLVYRLPPQRLLIACVWIAIAALLLRCGLAACGADWWTLYSATPCRMDALALGAAGACVLHLPALRQRLQSHLGLVGAVALAAFVVMIPLTHAYDRSTIAVETIGYTLLAVCSALLVTSVVIPVGRTWTGVAALLAWAPLRSVGKYSYAMYVFHNLISKLLGEPRLIARFGKGVPPAIALAYAVAVLIVSYLLALISFNVLEKHFLRLKRLLEPDAPVTDS
jgi:peptidoglycan/LPS O-acetylase OafA/YrhL